MVIAAALAAAMISGCANTQSYALPNGKTAYEATCTLWIQCTRQAKKMCPHGYRLVRGPLRPQATLPNGNPTVQSSRMDFACK